MIKRSKSSRQKLKSCSNISRYAMVERRFAERTEIFFLQETASEVSWTKSCRNGIFERSSDIRYLVLLSIKTIFRFYSLSVLVLCIFLYVFSENILKILLHTSNFIFSIDYKKYFVKIQLIFYLNLFANLLLLIFYYSK